MSEQKLKVVSAPEAKSQPETPPAEAPTKTRGGGRKRLRTMLLVVIPLVGIGFEHSRYVYDLKGNLSFGRHGCHGFAP